MTLLHPAGSRFGCSECGAVMATLKADLYQGETRTASGFEWACEPPGGGGAPKPIICHQCGSGSLYTRSRLPDEVQP